MLTTIKLNDQPSIGTNKVCDETVNWHLPFEFPAGESTATQTEPEDSLCIRLMAAQTPCCCGVVDHLPH
jgi:hypothetical protein